jgi:hypothetical protein
LCQDTTKFVTFVEQQKDKYMATLTTDVLVIKISGSLDHVTRTYLRVFLSQQKLTEKQLDVATALVVRYTEYALAGVAEPYASTLLFSTDTRKEVVEELKISAAHLNNTFKALIEKGLINKDEGKYFINPGIVPNSTLTFEFNIT